MNNKNGRMTNIYHESDEVPVESSSWSTPYLLDFVTHSNAITNSTVSSSPLSSAYFATACPMAGHRSSSESESFSHSNIAKLFLLHLI